MRTPMMIAAALLASAAPSALLAQQAEDSLQQMREFRTTGTSLDIPQIEQTGEKAERLRSILERIEMPDGFEIDLYAIVPDARHMALGNSVPVVFVGTRTDKFWAVTDRDGDRVADEVKEFAPALDLAVPNGPCMTDDGFLVLAEHNRVLMFPAAEFFYESPDVAVAEIVPGGELIPPAEESFNHGARVCDIGPDGMLYIALGQPFNVPAKEKMDLYNERGIGGIIRMNLDGSGREVYARGIRNSVGMDFNPANGELWFTDNQVDGMGDDIPPGEMNRITAAGQNFGFPWYGGGTTRTNEYMDEEVPADVVNPEAEYTAHAADLGMAFYDDDAFPVKYHGGIFSAQHGSWNRTTPVGARVMFTPVGADGAAGEPEVFAEGWLTEDGEYLGRPVDVAVMKDGSLLVSDDFAGAIYRISYQGGEGGSGQAGMNGMEMDMEAMEEGMEKMEEMEGMENMQEGMPSGDGAADSAN
ncbi:MAG: PQQ-dependent sugar dehydrogenase [Limimaricola sp.]